MQWVTIAGVILGAVFGFGSKLMTDHVRSRWEWDQQWADTRRLVYGRFLVALSQAHSRMVVAAFKEQSADERKEAVHHAFHSDPQHCDPKSLLRGELGIIAPDSVRDAARHVYERLRAARNELALSLVTVDSPDYRSVVDPFFEGFNALQLTMRDDLRPGHRPGAKRVRPGVGLPIVHHRTLEESKVSRV